MSRKTERAAKRAAKKAGYNPAEDVKSEEIPKVIHLESNNIIANNAEEETEEEAETEDIETEDIETEEAESEENIEGEENVEELQQQTRAIRPKINDEAAMTRITEQFKLKDLPWIETMTVTSSSPVVVEDSTDDMARELAFYQQALEAAKIGRELVKKAGAEFSRPDDYFAEMVKSDEHMAKIRQKLVDQEASIKASEDAKRQRQLKKFGKKVQVEKQLERQKQKSDTLEKIKLLKRKRKNEDLTTNDDFDIALESAAKKPKTNKPKTNKSKAKSSKSTKGPKKGGKKARR